MSSPILDAVALVQQGYQQQDDNLVQQGHAEFRHAADILAQAVLELNDRTLARFA